METGLPTIILLLLFGLMIASLISQQFRYMMASAAERIREAEGRGWKAHS